MSKSLKNFVDEALTRIDEISVEDVANQLGKPDFLLLDVREPEEFAAGRLPGSINVPRGFLEVRVDLEHKKRDPSLADRSRRIICICGGGHRSALAADALLAMGFDRPLSMAGGWTAWTEAGLPVESPSGAPTPQ